MKKKREICGSRENFGLQKLSNKKRLCAFVPRSLCPYNPKAGFTLIELLVGIAIVGMIMVALQQLVGLVLTHYNTARQSQGVVSPGRAALGRMVMFVQESDRILLPDTANPLEVLTVSERLSDQYVNPTHAYAAAGDGLPDGDANANGLIAAGEAEPITFDLDKTDTSNWRLMEQIPDYGTSLAGDFKPKKVLCEHVKEFSCKRLSAGRVEISLSLQQGSKAVTLRTTARARWVD